MNEISPDHEARAAITPPSRAPSSLDHPLCDISREEESHAIHLRALLRQERDPAYRRRDYLSREWQLRLWREEVERARRRAARECDACFAAQDREEGAPGARGRSPSSVIALAALDPPPRDLNRNGDACPESPPSVASGGSVSSGVTGGPGAPSEICARWRDKIVEWKYQIVDRFDLDRELVSISAHYMDRYLSTHYVDEESFQLVAMASIYLSVKIHSPRKVTSRSIASTGNGLVTARHIEAMELDLMRCLDWRLHPPTAAAFVDNLLPLVERAVREGGLAGGRLQQRGQHNRNHHHRQALDIASDPCTLARDILEFSKFLAELSVCAYPFVSARPSSVALAAVLVSFEYQRLPQDVSDEFGRMVCEVEEVAPSSPGLAVEDPEVEACGRLLRRVYALAVPNDLSFQG